MPDTQNPIESYPVSGAMAYSKKFGPLISFQTQAPGISDVACQRIPQDTSWRGFRTKADHKPVIVPCKLLPDVGVTNERYH